MKIKAIIMILIGFVILSYLILYGENTANTLEHREALKMFAKGNYSEALDIFERLSFSVKKDIPGASFYNAECEYQRGREKEAGEFLNEVLTTPFYTVEAHGRLIDIARNRADMQAVESYKKSMTKLIVRIEREYHDIAEHDEDMFNTTEDDSMEAAIKKAVARYSLIGGYPEEARGDRYHEAQLYGPAIKAYKYALEQHVPLSERFVSPTAGRLYEKLALNYKRYVKELQRQEKPDSEVEQASAMARYYEDRAFIVTVRSKFPTQGRCEEE